ncbi:MAG: flagellar biosynthesis anti-sigma factor FlgM [Lachnospiraceae bacterium]|nr:flagellar biosynthesis anti-sigma factor FlgM [Lachnospiraceae bacterium]
MRISSMMQVSQIYNANAMKSTTKTTSTGKKDQLELSALGKDYQVAKAAVSAASDVREDKVAAIKASMADGSYQVSTEDFAEKLLEAYKNKN